MTTQTETPRQQRIRAILDTAQALADGKDPADFPEFGFSPRIERLAEIFRGAAHDRDEAARIQARLAGAYRTKAGPPGA